MTYTLNAAVGGLDQTPTGKLLAEGNPHACEANTATLRRLAALLEASPDVCLLVRGQVRG